MVDVSVEVGRILAMARNGKKGGKDSGKDGTGAAPWRAPVQVV